MSTSGHVFHPRWPGAASEAPAYAGRPHAQRSLALSWAIAIAYAAALYPLLLCFLNTRVATMPASAIVVAEVLIGLAVLPVLAARINTGLLLVCLCISVNYLVLALLQQANDFKAMRDLLMPVVFVWLGSIIADRRLSERVLRNLAVIAVVLGLVEFVFPAFYTTLFDAIAFYAARGFAANNPFALTVLQVRPEGIGRSLLPFLGPRRISSFFLEPVALGNFAVLTAAWGLAKPTSEMRQIVWLMVLSIAMVIMADARFASITIVFLWCIRFTNVWRLRSIAAFMPLVAMIAMALFAWFGPAEYHDDIVGRFQVSGRNLIDMPWTAWLGIPGSISMDAGYGYIIQRTGLLVCLLLWAVYSLLPLHDDQAKRFHFNAAVYVALNLCISGSSLFSLKTSAILWLLLGTVVAQQVAVRTTASRPQARGA